MKYLQILNVNSNKSWSFSFLCILFTLGQADLATYWPLQASLFAAVPNPCLALALAFVLALALALVLVLALVFALAFVLALPTPCWPPSPPTGVSAPPGPRNLPREATWLQEVAPPTHPPALLAPFRLGGVNNSPKPLPPPIIWAKVDL